MNCRHFIKIGLIFVPLIMSGQVILRNARLQNAKIGQVVAPPPAGISISSTAWKNNANATSVAVTVSPTATHACVVFISSFTGDNANHAVSDNISGTTGWVKIIGTNVTVTGNTVTASFWVKYSMSASVTTITCTTGSGASTAQGIIHEVTGISAFTSTESSAATPAASTNPQTSAIANGTAASIMFAGLAIAVDGNPFTMTVNSTGSTGGTWALADTTHSQETDGDSWIAESVPYLIPSGTGSGRIHGWTTATSTGDALAVCFHQ